MSGSFDFNHTKYPYYEEQSGEGHQEPQHCSFQTNVKDETHPFFSPEGLKATINEARRISNSFDEKELSSSINQSLINEMMKTAKQLKLPIEIMITALDWKKDFDKRSDVGDIMEIGTKIKNMIPELRKTLNRDPDYAEIFGSFVLGGVTNFKKLIDKVAETPHEVASKFGTDKDDTILKKNRNDKTADRTFREVLSYMYKRMPNGNLSFLDYMSQNNV